MNATQPYDLSLEDVVKGNHDGMEVLGFRFSGQSSFQRSGEIKDQRGTEKRYDYVLTSIPLETYKAYDYWKAENKITATVTPIDRIDPVTEKKSSNVWTWTKPEFTIPTGHFNKIKENSPASIGTPLKKSLFYTKWYKIKYTYAFCATIYCM